MQLRSLHLNGFKSFARPVDLTFSPGVTAIVGPNGSGKSNVADAVRWVLGEMSRKTLRSKKSGDVIFAGSHLKAGHSMAEVTMTLDNADNQIPIDAAEVTITRRLFRNGDSEYEINGAAARLKDIHEILVAAGLAQRSYAVIGQGQADEIVRARPSERKEYFEEAAGIKQFQLKKEQTLRRLEATRRNLVRVEDLVREIKPRLNSLKRQADRAARREEIEKKWRSLSLTWFGAELTALNDKAKAQLQDLQTISEQRLKLEKQIASLEKTTGSEEQIELEEKREDLAQKIKEEEHDLSELENKRDALKSKIATLEEHGLPAELSSLPAELAQKESQLARVTKQINSLAPEINSLKKNVADAEENSLKAAAQIKTIRETLQKARPGRNLNQREIAKIVTNIKDLLDKLFLQIKSLQSVDQLPSLVQLADQPRQQVELLKSKVERGLPVDTAKLNSELDQIMNKRDTLLAALAKSRSRLATLTAEQKFLAKQQEALRADVAELNKRLAGAKRAGNEGAARASLEHLTEELKKIEHKISEQDQKLNVSRTEQIELNKQFDQSLDAEREAESRTQRLRGELSSIIEKQAHLNVIKGQHDVRVEDLLKLAEQRLGEGAAKKLAGAGATGQNAAERSRLAEQVERLRKQMELAGGVDQETLQEYRDTDKRFKFLTTQSEDLATASDKLRQIIHELDQKIHTRFNKAINKINVEFDKAFKILFEGGSAKLVVLRTAKKNKGGAAQEPVFAEESAPATAQKKDRRTQASKKTENEVITDQVTAEVEALRDSQGVAGIEIKATPPGKKLQGVAMLSGGEKALTSIALLSAILATKPSPFVVLDEVDAALDEANSRRFAKIINALSKKTQFITITHNRETMRRADILYGVTMQRDGISKLLSIKLDEVDENKVLTNV